MAETKPLSRYQRIVVLAETLHEETGQALDEAVPLEGVIPAVFQRATRLHDVSTELLAMALRALRNEATLAKVVAARPQ